MNIQFFFLWTVFLGFAGCNNSGNYKKDNSQKDNTKQTINIADTTAKTAMHVYGQSPKHIGLSNTFNFQSRIERFPLEYGDSCVVTVILENKITKKIAYSVHFQTNFLLGDSSFMNNNVRSYITSKNKNAEVTDNDFGDIVVADFNFDRREDFAVKKEEGGNGGPLYNYYIQTADKSFKLDKFLNDSMIWFPIYFNKNKKTLTTLVHASAVSEAETIYKLDTLTNKWAEVRQRLIDYKLANTNNHHRKTSSTNK